MKRNSLFTKIAALMLCVMMVIGCLPMSAFAQNITEGEMDIPDTKATLVHGDNALKVYTGMATTIYTYNATAEGKLSITMPNYIGWSYTLKKGETVVAESSTADADVIANPSIDVKDGDVVTLTVTTNGPTKPVTTKIVASFVPAPGTSADSPIKFYSFAPMTQTIDAGKTVYFSCDSYMEFEGNITFAFDGAITGLLNESISIQNGVAYSVGYNSWENLPLTFALTNNGEEAADVAISFEVPAGTINNPIELVLAPETNTSAGEGVHFVYVPSEDGTLTVNFPEGGNYEYQLQNHYTSQYKDWTSATTDSIAAGSYEKIIVLVNGDATFTASFEATPEEPEETDPPVETVPVAMVGDQGFATVAEALNAATSGTVTMIADSVEPASILIIKPGVTLYMGTYDLTAGYLIGLNGSFIYGDRFVDANNDCVADADYAALKVAQKNVSLSSGSVWYKEAENRKYIPVWYNDQYVFTQARFNNVTYTKTADDEGYTMIKFWAQFPDLRKNILLGGDGITDNDLSVIAVIKYTTADGVEVTSEYFYTTDLINNYVLLNYNLTCGMGKCDTYSNLQFQLRIVSKTGVAVETDVVKYESL